MTTQIPTKIGKYDVTGVIGRGGMGVVYQATDPHLDRRVAIKMITGSFSESPDMLKRFFREAQSLGSLQHPNIVTVFDMGDCDGNPYFVMEYLEGEGLDSILSNRGRLNLLEKIAIVIQVCNGLGYAHRRGVTHRDIKPANIMISKDGGVKIFDFGIAHAGHTNVTRTGEILGTLRYMAPEQVNSQATDSRTDIFSTGVVLYQLVTDHLPFDGDNTTNTLLKIVNDAPPPLGNFLTNFPAEMEQILMRALAKNPDERYATADDFALDLAQLQGQLKEEVIGREMEEVAALIDHGEVHKAQGSLLRVLKLDQQHTRANRLLREIQQRIQRDELAKQVQGLRERAEEALADQHFDRAVEHVDRGLALDRDNFDLMQLREAIGEAAIHAEKLHRALKIAEAAQADGKLEEARQATEEALALAPNDTQARTLHRLILRELEERARNQKMEGYLQGARQELSSRRFTAALMILKQAEELDPAAPQVHAMKETAVAGQAQERRRKELEAFTREVEEALNRDDYRTAGQKADEGLARFPDDRNLLKLKGLSDRQRQTEERKELVDGLMAESRVLLQEGRHEELQEKLERAIAKLGPEARLQSMLGVVSERLQRERMERHRAETLQQARQSLNNRAFDEAIQILEAQTRESGADPEVHDLLHRARAEQVEAVQSALSRSEQEAVLDVRVSILEEALRMSPRDGRVKEILHQARNLNQVITKIVAEAKKLEEDRQYDQAFAKWETVSAVYQHYPELKSILKRIRDLRDRAVVNAKQNWIDQIDNALRNCDYDRALSLLGPATQAFPWDSDLMGLQEQAEAGLRQRGKALKMLAEGRKAFANQQWEAGSQLMVRASQVASHDSLIRDQAVDELAQASRKAIEKDWQASELILRRLAEVDPTAAGSQNLQSNIQERKREEVINGTLNAARRQQASGDLPGAMREIGQVIGSYPDDRRLQEMQAQIEQRMEQAREAARLAEVRDRKEAFVQEALNRARQSFALDRRVEILEEALGAEPQETRLQQQLSAARELRSRVELLVSGARDLEGAHKYEQALAKWEALAVTYREYPGLDRALEQARQCHQQERLEAKSNGIRMVQAELSSADFKRAEELLAQAKRGFPGDRDLIEIERRIREGIANRAQAERCLENAAKAVNKEKWKKALESFQEAFAAAKLDPVVRDHVVSGLLEAANTALASDAEACEMLAAEAARLEPDSPMFEAVRSKIEAKKRGQLTEQTMSTATRCLSAGDWDGALRALDRGLASYPDEVRLQESKARLEGQIRRREEEQRRAREEELRQRQAREEQARDRESREAEQRARQQEEERQRALAQELEEAQRKLQPPIQADPHEVSATQFFVRQQGSENAAPAESTNTLHSQRAQGASEGLTSKIRQVLRDPTLFGKIQPPEIAPSNVDRGVDSDELQEALLPIIERQLANFIGPLAKILVKRGAAKTTSVLELYNILAASLEREDDRRAFLAKRAELFGGKANVQFTKLATPMVRVPAAAPLDASLPVEITPAAIELAARRLAAHLGPIAPILARKEARRATDLRHFYELLAEHVGNQSDRERFLKEAAIAKELPGPLTNRNETLSFNARSADGDVPGGQFKPDRKGE